MLLVDNLMHADLHPGNILLDAPAHRPPRIVLLDVGMVARLTKAESDAFIGLLHAMGAGDGVAAARAVLRSAEPHDVWPRPRPRPRPDPDPTPARTRFAESQEVCHTPERIAAFATDMDELFARTCRGFGTNVDFGEVLRGVLGLVRRHRVTLEANYMTLVMNVLCLEAMAAVLLPQYNVLASHE